MDKSDDDNKDQSQPAAFEQEADSEQPSLVSELIDQLKHNKKWWLTPIILVLIVLGLLLILGGTGAAPFIYTLF